MTATLARASVHPALSFRQRHPPVQGATGPIAFNPIGYANQPRTPAAPRYAGTPFSMAASQPLQPLQPPPKPPAAPRPPGAYDAFPQVALAKANETQGVANLDAWLQAQMGQAGIAQTTDLERMRQSQKLKREDIVNRLAGQGIIRSGDLGYLQGLASQDFAAQEGDLRGKYLNQSNAWWGKYLQQKQALKNATLGSHQAVWNALLKNPELWSSFMSPRRTAVPQQLVGRGF